MSQPIIPMSSVDLKPLQKLFEKISATRFKMCKEPVFVIPA